MATPPTLDIDGLLIAVSDDQPAGPELREAPDRNLAQLYFAVRDARKKAIDAERRLYDYTSMTEEERKSYGRSPDPADWQAVERTGAEALRHSKDLWVTAWLIEGLTRQHGFAGFRDGMLLARLLCEQFWEDIHPRAAADGGLSNRFAQFAGLDGGSSADGTLLAPLQNLPLTGGPTARPFSWVDHQDAFVLDGKSADVRQRRAAQGAVTLDLFNQAVAESGVELLEHVIADLEAAAQAFADFNTFLRSKEHAIVSAGGKPFVPSSSKIREALDNCLRLCRASRDAAFPQGTVDGATKGALVGSRPGADPALATDGRFGTASIETRQEAFATLLRVSEYFRRAEPHSPVSYALEQAVRWGRMSLPELLSDLVSDKSTREEIFRRAGIMPDPKD